VHIEIAADIGSSCEDIIEYLHSRTLEGEDVFARKTFGIISMKIPFRDFKGEVINIRSLTL